MKTVLEKPTKAEQKFAKETMHELEKISDTKKSTSHVYLSFHSKEKEESLEVPANVIQLLKFLLGNMAEGKAVQVSPVEAELSTQEAADILGVSRPFWLSFWNKVRSPLKKLVHIDG
ncbi:hypothetical protein [Paraflavitalea speifideaquila]|uniref:hypothetical protein n=1 Tax=Paraflavitalea speifideaquila TaxID=3076558 RepID=UPI0028F13881|nr:hypothetical protein [Paraflavitalea speifideiaquila]